MQIWKKVLKVHLVDTKVNLINPIYIRTYDLFLLSSINHLIIHDKMSKICCGIGKLKKDHYIVFVIQNIGCITCK